MRKKMEHAMREKSRGNRVLAAFLAAALSLSLLACGGGGGSASSSGSGSSSGGGAGAGDDGAGISMPAMTVKDGVARASRLELADKGFDMDGFSVLAVEDGYLYGYSYVYEDEGNGGYSLVRVKEDGSKAEKVKFAIPEEGETEVAAAAYREGRFYLAISTYSNSPAHDAMLEADGETGDAAGDADGKSLEGLDLDGKALDGFSEEATLTTELYCVSKEGELVWKAPVRVTGDGTYYIASLMAAEDGLYVVSSEGVDRYGSADGSYEAGICRIEAEDQLGTLYALEDGTVLMVDDSGLAAKILAYDASTKKFAEKATIPSTLAGATIFAGVGGHDLCLAGESGIYGLDLGSDSLAAIVNFVNSDLDLQGVTQVVDAGEGRIFIQAYAGGMVQDGFFLEPVAPGDVKDKKELTLGTYYLDYTTRSQVIEFNKASEDYRITIVDYSQYNLDEDDYENTTGLTRMNTDIVSGKAPDIMVLTEYMPVDKFIAKGILMDLTDFYQADKEIDRDSFFDNIVEAFRNEDRMYYAVPAFSVTGIAGKAKYIGDGKGLTIDKAREIAKARGINEDKIFGIVDRSYLFEEAIEFSGSQFMDRQAHTCNFDSQGFRDLLAFVKTFPAQIGDEQYSEQFQEDMFTQYLADKALLGIQYIGTLYDYEYMTRQLYGDLDVTVTGFPSEDNQGASVAATMKVGISSSASDPEGAWTFVRRFLLPDYQEKMEEGLPISETALRAQCKKYLQEKEEQKKEYDAYMRELNEAAGIDTAGETYTEDAAAEDGNQEAEDGAEVTEDMVKNGAEGEEESEDLTGKPVAEEDFDGSHEEYEAYLADFKADMAAAEGDEEVVLSGDQILAEEAEEAASHKVSDLPEFNEKDVEALVSLLKSLHFSVNGDHDVLNIIKEEAEAYFAGQKSAEEVSDIIQSRVQIYLKENE